MKAFLITDMPKCCNECKCNFDHWCSFDNFERYINDLERKPKWCPLRPLPEKKQIKNVSVFGDKKAILNDDALERNIYRLYWYKGWNECIDEITGETE